MKVAPIRMARRLPQRTLGPRDLWAVAALSALVGCGDVSLTPIDDDFCHGVVDSTQCDDGNACTYDDRCGQGVCRGRSVPDGVICDDGAPCTEYDYCEAGACTGLPVDCSDADGGCEVGVCDNATGACVTEPVATGEACDDGDPCTVADVCGATGCAGTARDCSGLDGPCTLGVCSADVGGCFASARADGTSCGDGATCTVEVCQAGECVDSPKCSYLDGPCRVGSCDAVAGTCAPIEFADGSTCSDGSPCTTGEACEGGLCVGGDEVPDATPCDDGDVCTGLGLCSGGTCATPAVDCSSLNGPCVAGTCSRNAGGCVAVPLLDGVACDDGDPCTNGTTCEGETCGGGQASCFCTGKPDGTGCDDGSKCTTGDACADGACVGAAVDCSSLDDGCIAGVCVEATGACATAPQPEGTLCNDGDACTEGDGCVAGECAGTPKDCTVLDGACTVGVCDAGTGACGIGSRPTGTPCDDGDTCTTHDGCDGGACEGGLEVCAACAGLTAGDGCDDSDACTSASQCASTANGLACLGEQPECADGPCSLGVCDPATGACDGVAVTEGAPCEDGDGCTSKDRCQAGTCAGQAINQCGAAVDLCEPVPGGSAPASAVALLGGAGSATALGTIGSAGGGDWYAVESEPGDVLSVETAGLCGSTLDTVVTLVAPDGETVLASADDGSGTVFAALSDVVLSQGGRYYIRVDAFGVAGQARYLITATVMAPPACSGATPCACADETCQAGVCVLPFAGETEPNDVPGGGELTVGQVVHGVVSGGADIDFFSVLIGPGQPLTLRTQGLCGSNSNTVLTVYGADGGDPIAADDDGGEDGGALIEGLVAPAGDLLYVAVTSPSLLTTPYILTVDSGWCGSDADCVCTDRACSGDADHPGACAPAHPIPEPSPDSPAPALALGPTAAHGEILPAFDVDAYSVTLASKKYTVRARPFCGSPVNPTVSVFAPGSDTPLAVATPDPDGVVLGTLVVTSPGDYRVDVKSFGAEVGGYLVSVEVAP